jgi:hypothetical protein
MTVLILLMLAQDSRCAESSMHATYSRAWIAARDAYQVGGSAESLKDVDAAIAVLSDCGARLESLVLQAAEAAAQSERESLAFFIDQAVQLESTRLAAGRSPAPYISAHEAAGELWLQVHRYEEARRAFLLAAERIGTTPRITLGLERVAARLKTSGK